MSPILRRGAVLRFEAVVSVVIEAAAGTFGAAPFAVCCVDLADEDGRRFALALHEVSPTDLDPAHFATGKTHSAPQWCRAAPLAMLAHVAAAVLGAEIGEGHDSHERGVCGARRDRRRRAGDGRGVRAAGGGLVTGWPYCLAEIALYAVFGGIVIFRGGGSATFLRGHLRGARGTCPRRAGAALRMTSW